MDRPICTEIANDINLWWEHVDPEMHTTQEEFESGDSVERLKTIHDLWPQDCNCEE